jgi:hypothetical protein
MRFIGTRVAAASATLLALLGLSAGSASADRWVQTVYGEPAAYYVPTSYVRTTYIPTSYVSTSYVPTTYVSTSYVPTSYVSTSYVPATYLPTTYVPTSYSYAAPVYYQTTYYRRPGLLRRLASRPVIETTRTYAYDYVPTVAYQPTTIAYDASVMTTAYATACGESVIPFNPPPAANGTETAKTFTSTPENSGEPTYNEKAATKAKVAKKADPVDDPKAGVDPAATGAGNLNTPTDEVPKLPVDPKDRTSFRKNFTTVQARDGGSSLPMLRGEVVSGTLGAPKPGMEVIFTDLKGTYPDKKKKTDAQGAFEVFLPNGVWAVSVLDPVAGTKPKEVIRVTSTAGRYLDEDDNTLYGLRINN